MRKEKVVWFRYRIARIDPRSRICVQTACIPDSGLGETASVQAIRHLSRAAPDDMLIEAWIGEVDWERLEKAISGRPPSGWRGRGWSG